MIKSPLIERKCTVTTLERFARETGLIICVESHPISSEWTANLRIDCVNGSSTLWLKETMQPPLAMAESAAYALEHLVVMCRGKTLIIAGTKRREILIPTDLAVKEG